jgi:putative ABC transport system permease protein
VNIFTEIKEGLSIAWDAVRANKMRSVLTTLGIIIGIVTVTAMAIAIDALNRSFKDSISVLGADVLFLDRTPWMIHSYAEWLSYSKRRDITRQQARQVEQQMTMAAAVAPVVGMGQTVWYKNRSATAVQILGTTDQFLTTSDFEIDAGRFINENEAEGGRPVCVLGAAVATNLFDRESPLGKKIRIGGRRLEVVGVLGKRGTVMGSNFSWDNRVIVPIQQFLIGYWRNPDFEVEVKVKDLTHLDDAIEELRGLMRKIRHVVPGDPDDFAINQQEQIMKSFTSGTATIAAVGLLITGLSLFVGGIGIMNIMFVSVAERTREIGVRKAIGARGRSILLQFLIEAALICLLGGLVGLGMTYGLILLSRHLFPDFPVRMSALMMGLAIMVSVLTGLISGFLPAWRAARMNPVDALRNE